MRAILTSRFLLTLLLGFVCLAFPFSLSAQNLQFHSDDFFALPNTETLAKHGVRKVWFNPRPYSVHQAEKLGVPNTKRQFIIRDVGEGLTDYAEIRRDGQIENLTFSQGEGQREIHNFTFHWRGYPLTRARLRYDPSFGTGTVSMYSVDSIRYFHDEAGLLKGYQKHYRIAVRGQSRVCEIFDYDENGGLIKQRFGYGKMIEKDGGLALTFTAHEQPVTTTYSEDGRRTSTTWFRGGEVWAWDSLVFDGQNRMRLRLMAIEDETYERRWIKETYDTKGRLRTRFIKNPPERRSRKTQYFYNEDGLLIEYRFYNASRQYVVVELDYAFYEGPEKSTQRSRTFD